MRVRSGTSGEVISRLMSSWLMPTPFPAMMFWAAEPARGKTQSPHEWPSEHARRTLPHMHSPPGPSHSARGQRGRTRGPQDNCPGHSRVQGLCDFKLEKSPVEGLKQLLYSGCTLELGAGLLCFGREPPAEPVATGFSGS